MKPAFLDSLSWEIAEVYGAVTDQILINLAKYFPTYNAQTFPRSSIRYQAAMLAQMGQVNKETMRIIRRNLVGASPALKRALEQVIIDGVRTSTPELVDAVKKGIFAPPAVPLVAPNQYRAFNLYYTQAANKLNMVNTVMLESTQQAYQATVADVVARVQATQTALDIGAGETITGVSTWNQATQHAIDRLKRDGITGFIDHGNHHWSAEAYVAMDIRTTMYNTARAAVWETNENFGNDLYRVSYHNGARPLCYPWQNKVISSTDSARVVADLDGYEVEVIAQSATSYGEAAGLFGINCKHYPMPFIPGVSVIRDEVPQDEQENARAYAESQEQRRLERKLRESRRDLLMEKERGASPETIDKLEDKCKQDSKEINEFCKKTGRQRRRDREQVYTERKFPAEDTYDVTAFEHKQKDMLEGFFSGGGAQMEYSNTPGMTPNVPIIPKPRNVATEQAEYTTDDIFSLLAQADSAPVAQIEETWQRSNDYGAFGLTNKSYPKELQYTKTEQELVDKIRKAVNDEIRFNDYSADVFDALSPVRRESQIDFKIERIEQARKRAKAKLAEAEKMIEQRKAEGYHGQSRAESAARWGALKKELDGADEIERGEILESARVGENGIRYWQNMRKEAERALDDLNFAEKIVRREKYAISFLADK